MTNDKQNRFGKATPKPTKESTAARFKKVPDAGKTKASVLMEASPDEKRRRASYKGPRRSSTFRLPVTLIDDLTFLGEMSPNSQLDIVTEALTDYVDKKLDELKNQHGGEAYALLKKVYHNKKS